MCLGARALPVEPLLVVDRRLLGCKRVGVTSSKHVSTQYKTACQESSQPYEGFLGDFGIKVNLTIHCSLFKIKLN